MIAYSQLTQKSINTAVTKAKKVRPLVKIVSFGQFDVVGSKGDTYRVSFAKVNGEFAADCTCKAQTNGKRVSICYHAVACSSLFKKQVADRAATPTLLERIETGRAHIAAIRATLATTQAPAPASRESICRKCFNTVVKNGLCADCNADLSADLLFG